MRTVTMRDVVRGAAAALVIAGVALAEPARVEFASPHDGATLVGTLTMPEGDGPFAAAVFVNATGDHPRDEARSGGRQWADLADALAQAGVASLRLDARGVGESVSAGVEGWAYRWTSAELAQDMAQAVEVVRGFDGIDGARVGLVCFSDGCATGAIAAADVSPAFVVLLSPSGVPAKAHILAEQRAQLAMTGAAEEDMAQIVPVIERALETLADAGASMEDCRERVADVLRAMGAPDEQALMSADAALEELGQRGVRWYLGYDPAPALAALDAPTFALVGGDDDRQQGEGNLAALAAALGAERVVVLEGLGHFLGGDDPATFAADVVERVAAFVATNAD
jgi:pimeloyl-ACP methyl ester carboxylesterase